MRHIYSDSFTVTPIKSIVYFSLCLSYLHSSIDWQLSLHELLSVMVTSDSTEPYLHLLAGFSYPFDQTVSRTIFLLGLQVDGAVSVNQAE